MYFMISSASTLLGEINFYLNLESQQNGPMIGTSSPLSPPPVEMRECISSAEWRVLWTDGRNRNHHALWLVVHRAIKNNGIAENDFPTESAKADTSREIKVVRKRIEEESEHAALRIAALVSLTPPSSVFDEDAQTAVLLDNSYLQLDP